MNVEISRSFSKHKTLPRERGLLCKVRHQFVTDSCESVVWWVYQPLLFFAGLESRATSVTPRTPTLPSRRHGL